jgi:hypothetical protein
MVAITIKNKQGVADTTVEHKHKGETVTQGNTTEKVGEEAMLTGALCEVGVEASLTINLGNFNSTRLQTSLKVPCPHVEIDEVWEFARDWVNDKMEKLAADVQAADGAG